MQNGAQGYNMDEATDIKREDPSRQSLYVEIFQSIQNIVMEKERFLFSPVQQTYLDKIQALSYNARYLLVRLCLCKRGKWHSLASLEKRYSTEIGGKEDISKAIDELCGITVSATHHLQPQPEVIDLTIDSDEECKYTTASTSDIEPELNFAEDEQMATLRELLDCLQHEELKDLGKEMKVLKAGQNRCTLSEAIISTASKQLILGIPVLFSRNNTMKNGSQRQPSALNFSQGNKNTQAQVVKRKVWRTLGRCIRICPAIFSLLDRLNIVFFRSTSYTPSLLLPALLEAFQKRKHAPTDYTRTIGIFPSCQALSDYQDALILEARIDEAVAGKNNTKGHDKAHQDVQNSRLKDAEVVRDIFRGIYDRWRDLAICEDREEPLPIRRFHHGHVLTRIVYNGAEALGILKDYVGEMEVLKALLSQKKWRRGKRGAWYDRIALIIMTHLERTPQNLEAAMDMVVSGLEDELTHLLYRPRLQRRLCRLEKQLDLPFDERHKCERQLQKAKDVYVEGIRVKSRTSHTPVEALGQSNVNELIICSRDEVDGNEASDRTQRWKGSTRWLGKDGTELSVEEFALEFYSEQGYKGFHSEGSIVFTIFGLLFWDIIFAAIPGAFETPYQSAPLDLFEDSFYEDRKELITGRLEAIAQGQAHQLLEEVYDRESSTRTTCIGVRWDFSKQDLLEIIDCVDGKALALICQAISEDYSFLKSGVPDLLVWNMEFTDCKFVEVKSTNDRLQENQRVWIDLLIGANISVELCHILEGQRKTGRISPSHSRVNDIGDDKHSPHQMSTRRDKRSRDSDDSKPTASTSKKQRNCQVR